ncbi:hypothetical protein V8C35DRAFT_196266 [Trichoderma chlorosporum]
MNEANTMHLLRCSGKDMLIFFSWIFLQAALYIVSAAMVLILPMISYLTSGNAVIAFSRVLMANIVINETLQRCARLFSDRLRDRRQSSSALCPIALLRTLLPLSSFFSSSPLSYPAPPFLSYSSSLMLC